MKQVTALLLLALALAAFFREGVVVIAFKANQTWIAENRCVYRFDPKNGCKGQCVLMKKLAERQPAQPVMPAPCDEQLVVLPPAQAYLCDSVPPPSRIPDRGAARPLSGFLVCVFHPPQPGC